MPGRKLALSALRRLIDSDATAAAAFLQEIEPEEASSLLCALPAGALASVTGHLHPRVLAGMLETLSPAAAGDILQRVGQGPAADAFRAMAADRRAAVVESLPGERRRVLQELLSYPEDSAGRLMTADHIALPRDMTVREAVARLRDLAHHHSVATYAYVVGPENRLTGVLNMRDLLLADPGASLESVMRKGVVAVSPFMGREELVRLASERQFIAFPVADADGRLLGVVSSHLLLEPGGEAAAEDLQILFGGGADERVLSPVGFKVSRRLGWLLVNLATAFLASGVVALFEDLITRFAVLAVFLPVVAGQGGNAGTQSLAVILRGLIMREIRPADAAQAIWKESAAGLLNGVIIGVVTAAIVWAWKGNPALGLVIGLAMIVNLVAAGAAGAAIPIAMKRLGFDPAQSSGIFLTTVTDVVGFLAFLGFATFFARWLA
ncbi:MAG: magnesium transporter [Elusimicrobia bacterium]|nr:magnesium transporter [Elusimicrobiota bacterium]